jgi:magnesium transporter
MRWLIDGTQVVKDPGDAEVAKALHEGDQPPEKWLELNQPTEEELRVPQDALGWHSLALSTYQGRHQRPSIASFGSFLTMTLITPTWSPRHRLRLLPLSTYLGRDLLVTVHRHEIPALDEVRTRLEDPERGAPGGLIGALVIDTFVDAGFQALEAIDKAIDRLEDAILSKPSPEVLRDLYRLRHEVAGLHTALGAQLDVFQRLLLYMVRVDRSAEIDTAFRSIYEQVVRQYEVSDSLRDLISGAMDVYLSTVSNRLNSTMAQLTLVASVFLPLTFLTGFFGMNFAFLVTHITTEVAFAIGLVVMVTSIGLMLTIFRLRRWI